jgi:S1-C subfamily serine protease
MNSDSRANNSEEYAYENIIPAQSPVDGTNPSKLSKLNFVITVATFLCLVIGIVYAWGPVTQYRNTDPTMDCYVQPRSIADLVDLVQDSTVSIYCEFGSEGDYELGSGWALDIETEMKSDYPTALVTNYHVIENCMNGKGEIFVEALEGKRFPAIIDNWDIENDLAVIVTKLKIKPLELSQSNPSPGYWVMAVGTADGYEGSVAFGNVLNVTDTEVLITAAISSGNSGGPLVDNEGKVIGTNSWSATKEQYNGAMSLDAMCIGIMKCDGKTYWKWD